MPAAHRSTSSKTSSKPLVVLSGGPGWHALDLLRAAHEEGIDARLESFETLRAMVDTRADREPSSPRVLVVRTMPRGTLEQVIFRMDVLHAAELAGDIVLNPPRALETAIDKYLSLVRLSRAGLPIPPTRVDQELGSALASFEALGGDVVLKPLFGSEGRGIERITSEACARRAFTDELARTGLVYQQSFVDHGGRDLRVFILDGEAIAAMARRSLDGFITNVARGGVPEATTIDGATRELAVRAASAVGARVAGVDLLSSRDGKAYVIEVNAVPGWRALSRVTGIDVARAVVRRAMADAPAPYGEIASAKKG